MRITLPATHLDPDLTVVVVEHTQPQPYLPKRAIRVDGTAEIGLPMIFALSWRRADGEDYYSLRPMTVRHEWILQPVRSGCWDLVVQRQAGTSALDLLITVAGQRLSCSLAEGVQRQTCHGLALKAGPWVSLEIQSIDPAVAMDNQELTLELVPA